LKHSRLRDATKDEVKDGQTRWRFAICDLRLAA